MLTGWLIPDTTVPGTSKELFEWLYCNQSKLTLKLIEEKVALKIQLYQNECFSLIFSGQRVYVVTQAYSSYFYAGLFVPKKGS